MQRAPIVISATVAGVAAVVGFHTHPQARAGVQAASTPTSTAPKSTAASTRSAASRRTTSSQSNRVTSPTAKTATGAAESNQYGDVQVRVTVKGNRITDVTAIALPESDPKSQEISSFAGPQLRSEVLAAQSASIDGVSGASYTSQGYEASVQSALDKAGFKA